MGPKQWYANFGQAVVWTFIESATLHFDKKGCHLCLRVLRDERRKGKDTE